MLCSILLPAAALLAATAQGQKPFVTPRALVDDVVGGPLVAGGLTLQRFARLTAREANKYYQKNRVFGGQAHNDTVTFIYNQLMSTGAYNVELQPQTHPWSDSNQTLTVAGERVDVSGATYAPNGNVTAGLIKVRQHGCFPRNFPATVSGKLALIERGECTFGDKVALAGNAGAAGAIIYNNEPGSVSGTLGEPTNPKGPYVPVGFVSQEDGQRFVQRLSTGSVLRSTLFVNAVMENRLTYNVIATTKSGDQDNVVALGAHTDSVNEGPGINDDGTGTIGILHVAKNLAKYRVRNAVRFGFWTAEEFGLLGSTFYVDSLSGAELNKIRLYLNFDMIGSPNYVYSIYDGDGSTFNMTGPPGSAAIERLFQAFYSQRGTPFIATAFDGRSDYQAFINNDIPAGGLFTGAEEIKTQRQADRFGGKAGVAYDSCYHQRCDNASNVAIEAFYQNTQAISFAVGTYANAFPGIPKRGAAKVRRSAGPVKVRDLEQIEDGVTMSCGHRHDGDVAI